MKRFSLFLLLTISVVLVAGCGDESEPTASSPTVLAFAPDKSNTVVINDEILASLEYEEFWGTIYPGMGGWLQTSMATWPGGSAFSIMVPPEALSGDPSESVAFSMRIPTQQSYWDYYDENGIWLPLIILLEPAGVNFAVPVTVMGTWMPWVPFQPSGFDAWTVNPDYEDYGPVRYLEFKKMWRVMYEAPHFSDWVVTDKTIVEE